MLVVPARKSEESEMKLECLTPEFPQGARVYSVDGVAPSLLNSASAMRSQAILVSGGGQHATMKRLSWPGRTVWLEISLTGIPIRTDAE